MDSEFVEEVLERYLKLEEDILKKIDEMEGSDEIGSTKWRLRNQYSRRVELIKQIHYDLLE